MFKVSITSSDLWMWIFFAIFMMLILTLILKLGANKPEEPDLEQVFVFGNNKYKFIKIEEDDE